MRRSLRILVVLVVILLAAAAWLWGVGWIGPEPSLAALPNLTSIDDLEDRFNSDRGDPRLLILVAPT